MKNQRILRDFERRLEGAVEGFFARAFRSGLQPIELAKGVRRYAEEQRQLSDGAVIVPNAYRFRVNPKDAERLAGHGPALLAELATVLDQTVRDEDWALAGPSHVSIESDEAVAYGMFRLAGRVDAAATPSTAEAPAVPDATEREANAETSPPSAVATPPTAQPESQLPRGATNAPRGAKVGLGVVLPDGTNVDLEGTRLVVGRAPTHPIPIDHTTVSRSHAAFVNRGGDWWVLDLGSTNGTRINGRPAAEHPVSAGDHVEFGEVVVEVVER